MQLTRMTDYALRLLIYVAGHPDRLCTIAEVAAAYDISQAHLMKITHQLGLEGWVETVRGKGGGIRLARRPREINLGAVMRSTESDFHLVPCFVADSTCPLTGNCGLADVVEGALQAFQSHINRFTLADVLKSTSPARMQWKPISGPRKRAT
ncbi:MAG: Rrf2 family transcriptional regulator [Pseudomonadota bacterium]